MRSQAFRHDNENAASATAAEGGAPPAEHCFSESYQQRRQALIAEYGDRQEDSSAPNASSSHFKWRTIAIAAAAALVVVPVSAWAVASNADFFAGAFGSNARESVQAHDEVQGYKDGNPVMVTYPTREYVEADIEAAEELLGPYTSTEETKVDIGDHTLTIQSAVRDKDTMVVGYTLERQLCDASGLQASRKRSRTRNDHCRARGENPAERRGLLQDAQRRRRRIDRRFPHLVGVRPYRRWRHS